jgi:hypothetical protein
MASRSAAMERRSVMGDLLGDGGQFGDLAVGQPVLAQPSARIRPRWTIRSE